MPPAERARGLRESGSPETTAGGFGRFFAAGSLYTALRFASVALPSRSFLRT